MLVFITRLGSKLVETKDTGKRAMDSRPGQPKQAVKECPMDLIRILIAILLPPLGVFLQVGIGKHFWINILLTLLGYIPGIVHAVWVIAKK